MGSVMHNGSRDLHSLQMQRHLHKAPASARLDKTRNLRPGNSTHSPSLSFPKLSELYVVDFLPDPSSSIFTTSNLTSLSLNHIGDQLGYTRSQLSQILQWHSNLRELVLEGSALPSVEGSGPLVPIILPRLIDLRLCGMGAAIAGFMDLISTSPLHNVAPYIKRIHVPTVPGLPSSVKQILTTYYGCHGLEHPRKVDHLAVSLKYVMVIGASSSPTVACHPTYNIRIQTVETINTLATEIVALFSFDHTRTFAATELDLVEDDWNAMLQNMKDLSHLQLDRLDIGPVMDALGLDNRGARRMLRNYVKSLTHTHS